MSEEHQNKVVIGEREQKCFEPEELLNDVFIYVFLRELIMTNDTVIAVPSILSHKLPSEIFKNIVLWLPVDCIKFWIFPACYDNHLCIITVNHKKKMVKQYDSIRTTERCARRIRNFLNKVYLTTYRTQNLQPITQDNDHDCSVICIDVARQITHQQHHITANLNRTMCSNELNQIVLHRGREIFFPRFDNDFKKEGFHQ